MRDVIVIGGGIIGATIGKAFKQKGCDVRIIDAQMPMAGTVPSGGHLKPSWFGSMPKKEYEPAMELLDSIWGLKKAEFAIQALGVNTGVSTTVYRVDTDKVVGTADTFGHVYELNKLDNYPIVKWDENHHGVMCEERCRLLVVAAGVWCDLLLPNIGLKIQQKRGVSFRFQGKLKQAFINPWAPYKQVVAHQQTSEQIWIGDGSAILKDNWDDKRTEQCRQRCQSNVPTFKLVRTLTGLRPYCESGGDPCLLKKVGPRAWVVTGAGKSGTISAGWAARRLLNEKIA